MNHLSTIKSAFILFFILTGTLTLQAQDNTTPIKDTTKVIIVVTPGQNYKRTNNTTPSTVRDTASNVMQQSTAPADQNVIQPVQSTTPVNQTTTTPPPVQTPGRPMNPKKIFTAPTTAERTGTSQYLPPVVKPAVTQAPAPTSAPPASTPAGVTTPVVAAKDTTHAKKDTIIINGGGASGTSTQAVFIEVGGPGLAISGNYDTRLFGTPDGWGYRIGAGYFGSGGNTVFTVPIQVNYLLSIGSSSSSFFEFGAGTTFLNSNGNNRGSYWEFDRVTGFIATGTLGYRYQSSDSRINFRIGFVPIIYDEGLIPAGGLSIGYTFP